MIIRNNTDSRRTGRYQGKNQTAIGKTLEKLSSGYRINRSADDAAGLAISEKMRLNISGLNQARLNSMEGTKLIQTGEGALQEIQDMLHRAECMATQSANGTYEDALDRENLQKELEHICSEIDRISKEARFNTIELFQDVGLEGERTYPQGAGARELLEAAVSATVRKAANVQTTNVQTAEGGLTLEQVRRNTKPGEFNIVYIENDFTTTQNPTNDGKTSSGGTVTYDPGVTNPALNLPVDGTGGKKLHEILQTQIVPQIVQNLVKNYPAFYYLNGSSIGIGLRLYDDSSSTVMASVTGGISTGGTYGDSGMQSYMLSVNIAHIKDTASGSAVISEEGRTKLEATIAHEMVHAFMYEASTAGMFSKTEPFPDWFVEGMAQTASGPDNWVKTPETVTNPDGSVTTITHGGLQIDKDSTDDVIKAQISSHPLGARTTASQYGTGYLACMYLGAAVAAHVDASSPASKADASSISYGLNQLLSEVIGGSSLDKAISKLTGFASISDFQLKFNNGTAADLTSFVRGLLTATGSGLGGIVSGDLTASDLAANTDLSDINLFRLNTDHAIVENVYPAGHIANTGGTAASDGTKPTEFTPTFRPGKGFWRFPGIRDRFVRNLLQ